MNNCNLLDNFAIFCEQNTSVEQMRDLLRYHRIFIEKADDISCILTKPSVKHGLEIVDLYGWKGIEKYMRQKMHDNGEDDKYNQWIMDEYMFLFRVDEKIVSVLDKERIPEALMQQLKEEQDIHRVSGVEITRPGQEWKISNGNWHYTICNEDGSFCVYASYNGFFDDRMMDIEGQLFSVDGSSQPEKVTDPGILCKRQCCWDIDFESGTEFLQFEFCGITEESSQGVIYLYEVKLK